MLNFTHKIQASHFCFKPQFLTPFHHAINAINKACIKPRTFLWSWKTFLFWKQKTLWGFTLLLLLFRSEQRVWNKTYVSFSRSHKDVGKNSGIMFHWSQTKGNHLNEAIVQKKLFSVINNRNCGSRQLCCSLEFRREQIRSQIRRECFRTSI